MGRFSVIPQDTFDEIQMDAGVVLTSFDPTNPVLDDSKIVCATTGGINITCTPTYSDFGEDIDNCPNNTKELKHLDSWECKITFTAVGTSPEVIKKALGSADISGNKVTPRKDISQSDFADLWWVGDRSDGGLVAVKVINALGTDGFSLQTTKNGKGQISVGLTGHVSINNQTVMPMEFYSIAAPTVTLDKSTASLLVEGTTTITATTDPAGKAVTWSSSNNAVASVTSEGVVTGESAGTAVITATVTDGGNTASCTVTVSAGA